MNALHCITATSKRDDRSDVAVTHLLLPSMCSCARSVDVFLSSALLDMDSQVICTLDNFKAKPTNVVHAGLHHGINIVDGTLERVQKVLTHMHQTVIADLWVSARRLVSQLRTTL